MRKLASVQIIDKLDPIPGADKIERATVLGWEVVVRKGQFQVGDKCIYIECDSQLPVRPEFEFLRERKFRVKIIRLRKQISEGLIFSLAELGVKDFKVGTDISAILGITKHNPEAEQEKESTTRVPKNKTLQYFMKYAWFRNIWNALNPREKKGWPEYLRKTDETRIQAFPQELSKCTNVVVSVKLDGQSGSFFLYSKKNFLGITKRVFGVCSRNLYLKTKHNCNWWNIAIKENIEAKLRRFSKDICIQGEVIGPGIQDNKYHLTELKLYVFNVWDIKRQCFFTFEEMRAFCSIAGFQMVPIVHVGELPFKEVHQLVEYADAPDTIDPSIPREGIVIRSVDNYYGDRPISFKVINPSFLLKYDL